MLKEEFLKDATNGASKNLKRDITWLVEELPENLSSKDITLLNKKIEMLKTGKPLAYVMKFVPFYNTKIIVNENVLIPRSETELLVDTITKKWHGKKPKILDLCAGSGAISVALSKSLQTQVLAVDIDKNCLKIVKQNAKLNNANVQILESDMFEKISGKFDVIVSNPPYIPTKEIEKLDKSVKDFEPYLALDGGEDGLKFYKIIAENAKNFLNENGELFLEIGFDQGKKVAKLLEKDFCDINIKKDYFNLERYILAKKR